MRATSWLLLLGCSAACSGAPSPEAASPEAASPEATAITEDPLAEVAWLEGRWQSGSSADGAAEHWTRIGDALFGVGLTAKGGRTGFYEVLVVHEKSGGLVYTAMPGGRREVDFRMREGGEQSAEFVNPANDFPASLLYSRRGDVLSARLTGKGQPPDELSWQRGSAGRAAELEDADRAFARDVAARGLDAWVEWFDAEGTQWRAGPVTGRERIRHLMAPSFARPDFRIDWAPVASGMSPAGDLGYTAGTSRITWTGADGAPAEPYCGIYVTIWRRQTDGAWRALFDAGWQQSCPASTAS